MNWGLALSGGGVLGAAHLGVLRAFREWGIWPDALSGTSAGGLVAGALSAGCSLEDLTAYGAMVSADPIRFLRPRVIRLAAELLPHDPLPPADSLLDSVPFVEGLLALCPWGSIQEWRWPTAVTAVDLGSLQAVAFVRAGADFHAPGGRWRMVAAGDLRPALQGTMAIPGVFTPARGPGVFLVDGGAADTLPVDWAAALGTTRVVAVDVTPPEPGIPPRAGILWSVGQTLSYMTSTLSRLRGPERLPVLRLRPDTRVPFPGFAEYDQLVEAGYEEAVRRKAEVLDFVGGVPLHEAAEPGKPAEPAGADAGSKRPATPFEPGP